MLTRLLSTLLMLQLSFSGAQPATQTTSEPVETFDTAAGTVAVAEDTSSKLSLREYAFADGRTVFMERATAAATDTVTIGGDSGTLYTFDPAAGWSALSPLDTIPNGTELAAGQYYVETDRGSAFFVAPLTYVDRGTGMIEALPDSSGTVSLRRQPDALTLTFHAPALSGGAYADFWGATAPYALLDLSDPAVTARWNGYDFTGANRWCQNGYYYAAEANYYPNGDHYFSNLPAAYITCKLLRDGNHPLDEAIGLAQLDVMRGLRNAAGYLPSDAGSQWLRDDYGILPGYFDTRFNTDLATAMLDAAARYGVTAWLSDAERYAAFYAVHAENHHFSFGTGSSEGWLVQDYSSSFGNQPTHASLNHHVAETTFLYRLASLTGVQSYADLADRLIRGIEQTETRWVLPSGNLVYAYLPDGSMGLTDYPYLVYTDLTALQAAFTARYGVPNEAVARLLSAKKQWMDANGVVVGS